MKRIVMLLALLGGVVIIGAEEGYESFESQMVRQSVQNPKLNRLQQVQQDYAQKQSDLEQYQRDQKKQITILQRSNPDAAAEKQQAMQEEVQKRTGEISQLQKQQQRLSQMLTQPVEKAPIEQPIIEQTSEEQEGVGSEQSMQRLSLSQPQKAQGVFGDMLKEEKLASVRSQQTPVELANAIMNRQEKIAQLKKEGEQIPSDLLTPIPFADSKQAYETAKEVLKAMKAKFDDRYAKDLDLAHNKEIFYKEGFGSSSRLGTSEYPEVSGVITAEQLKNLPEVSLLPGKLRNIAMRTIDKLNIEGQPKIEFGAEGGPFSYVFGADIDAIGEYLESAPNKSALASKFRVLQDARVEFEQTIQDVKAHASREVLEKHAQKLSTMMDQLRRNFNEMTMAFKLPSAKRDKLIKEWAATEAAKVRHGIRLEIDPLKKKKNLTSEEQAELKALQQKYDSYDPIDPQNAIAYSENLVLPKLPTNYEAKTKLASDILNDIDVNMLILEKAFETLQIKKAKKKKLSSADEELLVSLLQAYSVLHLKAVNLEEAYSRVATSPYMREFKPLDTDVREMKKDQKFNLIVIADQLLAAQKANKKYANKSMQFEIDQLQKPHGIESFSAVDIIYEMQDYTRGLLLEYVKALQTRLNGMR